jgi:4-hydroxybenzoate polyprenyltransferase
MANETDFYQLFFTSLIGINGTILIYGFDFGYGAGKSISNYLKNSRKHKFQSFFLLQLVLVSFPLSLCFLGLIYSLQITLNGQEFRFKRVLLVKNGFIGFAWGALILVGAGTFELTNALLFFWFMSLQIFVGSIARDCADLEHDKKMGVQTLPLKLGLKRTVLLLQLANALTGLVLLAFPISMALTAIVGLNVVWRGLVIYKVSKNNDSMFWTQTLNILACLFFYLLVLFYL